MACPPYEEAKRGKAVYYVFWDDDYADSGGTGLQEFSNVDDALSFIVNRLKDGEGERILEQYKLIRGEEMELYPVELVTKVGFRPK